jgi:signal transduction histidine kinase/ligand-binding sensor domain-containing protein
MPVRGWALDPTRTIAQFHHTSWSTEDGVPADVWAITQTPDGYLWLGSTNGLYRFDGERVERISPDLFPSPSIHALAATPSGGLWIGYERPVGFISLLQGGVVTNFSIDAQNSTSLHNIMLGPNNTVWAATPDNILKFDGQGWRAIDSDWGTSLGEASGGVWAFGVARDGVVWSRNRNGLFYLRPGESRFIQAQGYVGGVASFTATPDGRLWTTDSAAGHLYALPDLQDARGEVVPAPTPGIPVSEPLRGAILLDRDGALWFTSSSGGGLSRVRTRTQSVHAGDEMRPVDRFMEGNGLSSNVVHTLFEDREGNIWVGTDLGLDRFRPANVVAETRIPAGFRARFVQSTHGALYAYTGWSNTAARTTDGSESLYRILPNRAPEVLVRNIGRLRGMLVDDETGAIWLSTTRGLQQLKGNALGAPIPLPSGVEGESVYSAVQDKQGAFWISAFGHGVFRQEHGTWKAVVLHSARPATAVLTPDPGGDMWVRYSGGTLFRVSGDAVRDYSRSVPDIGDLTFIKPDALGLLIGGEFGIARFDGERFYAIHSSRVPALSVITGIAETADGSTWVFTQAGILRIVTKDLENALRHPNDQSLRYELIGPRDGLPGAPYGAVYGSTVAVGPDGRVWFTTGQGLVWLDPTNLYRNPLPPPVVVRSLTVNRRAYTPSSNVSLTAGDSNVQIDYTALSLSIPERERFRYKLEGVDRDWIDAGDRRQAFYTKLGPGTYSFHVIASNNDGVWNNTGATLAFSIPPTFFQSQWFILLCALAGAATLWLLYSLRLKQMSARIQARLEERLAERERIARELHDTLLQGFQGLMLRFQSVADSIPPDQPARQLIEDTMARGDDVLTEGRDRVRNLRGAETDHDLPQALRDATRRFAVPSSPVDFRVVVEGTLRTVHPVVCDELISICNEAIRNAFNHANAKNIEARIMYHRTALRVRIRDDGKGINQRIIDAGGRKGHFGLAGMRERAQKIKAQFTLSSLSGAGTEVLIQIPGSFAYAKESARNPRISRFALSEK